MQLLLVSSNHGSFDRRRESSMVSDTEWWDFGTQGDSEDSSEESYEDVGRDRGEQSKSEDGESSAGSTEGETRSTGNRHGLNRNGGNK